MNRHERFYEVYNKAYLGLNAGQKKAVDTIEGPVLVIAGPGTGKTQILAVRIGKILEHTDALPENILCLTYTDAGTIAMRRRLNTFIGADAYRVHIYTFHAFCNHVIQQHTEYFSKKELELVSDLEKIQFVEDILRNLPLDHVLRKFKSDLSYDTKKLLNLFQMMKEEDWSAEKISIEINTYLQHLPERVDYVYQRNGPGYKKGDIRQNKIDEQKEKMETLRAAAQLYHAYQKKMLENGRYDYSDMILWVLKAFRENENILRTYQEQYLYFLVDEFQDTNGAQYEILQQLIAYWSAPNVFAVGDDDQSIYEFQGARVKNIMDFYHAYENDIAVTVLTENYRSTQPILDAAKAVIDNNTERLIHLIPQLDKNITAASEERKAITLTPLLEEYENEMQEAIGVTLHIEALLQANVPSAEIAVLYYRHKHAEQIIRLFEKRKIPISIREQKNILDEPLVQNILSVLEYLMEENNTANSGEHLLFKVMHFPFFGLHVHDIAAMAAYLSNKRNGTSWRMLLGDTKMLAEIKLKDPEAIVKFEKTITHWLGEMQSITLQMVFEKILNESGLLKYIITGDNREWELQCMTTFFDFLKTESTKTPRLSIVQFLDTLRQMEMHGITIPMMKTIEHQNGVNFSTTHASKGLEFEHVFMIGCNQEKWDKAKSGFYQYTLPDTLTNTKGDSNIESLRRLFFVAMTRAKQYLHITFSKNKNDGKPLQPAKFISELQGKTGIAITGKEIPVNILTAYAIANLSETQKPKIDLFSEEFVRRRLEHYVLSASSLNAYLDCPLKFYFQNVIKIPQAKSDAMSFGSAIHYAMRKVFERMKADAQQQFPPLEIVLKDFEQEMLRNKDSFTDKQFENRMLHGKKILPEYYDQYKNTWNKIVVTEFPLRNVVFENIPLTGTFDKIEFTGNDVNVVDYKTGSVTYGKPKLSPPSDKNPLGGDYWRQIIFYKILLDNYKAKSWRMLSGEIDFIEKDAAKNQFVKQKFYLPEGEVETVKQQIRDTYKNIMNLHFTEGCGKEDCTWCAFVRENYVPAM